MPIRGAAGGKEELTFKRFVGFTKGDFPNLLFLGWIQKRVRGQRPA